MSVSEMILSLKNQKITMGEPWKLPKASGFLVPLIARPPHQHRNYVLLQEVEDQVDFRDSGGISGVDALNRSGKNVYVRKGTMLKGTGTQSRTPVTSYVLTPDKVYKRINVNCIHQSHGIRSGSEFKAEGVAPLEVYSSLGEQSRTWASISDYTVKQRAAMPEARVRYDNLVGVESILQGESDTVVDALKNIPGDHVDQVGAVVFDLKGVVAVEVFNHPESWRAFSESIIRSYRGVLTEEAGELIEVRTDKAADVFKKYIEKLSSLKRTLLTENKVSKVWGLRSGNIEGELTQVEKAEIHLTLNRVAKKPRSREIPELLSIISPYPVQAPETYEASQLDAPEEEFIQKKGGYTILSELEQTPQRFTELLEKVDVSRGTLALRIKEAEEIGLIEKGIRKTNGYPSYTLTEEGEKTKKKADKKAK